MGRTAQTNQWNYTCVVGEKEKADLSVTVRQRDVERPIGNFNLKQFISKLQAESLPSSQPINKFESFEGRVVDEEILAPPVSSAPCPSSSAVSEQKVKEAKAS